jgi:hypothetical protein
MPSSRSRCTPINTHMRKTGQELNSSDPDSVISPVRPSSKLSTGSADHVGGMPVSEQYSMEELRAQAKEKLSKQAKEYKVTNRTKETIGMFTERDNNMYMGG